MRLLLHADDYGLSEGANAGIRSCLESRCLDGASVMAGCLDETAIRTLGHMPSRHGIPALGAHLTVLDTTCTAPPERVSLLVDDTGTFRHSLGSLFLALSTLGHSRVRLIDQIAEEWSAQMDWILSHTEHAASPVYMDGHQHVHAIPALRPVLAQLCKDYPIVYVRTPSEHFHFLPGSYSLQVVGMLRREVLRHWSRGLKEFIQTLGIYTSDAFIGAFSSASLTYERVEASLKSLRQRGIDANAVVEIMCHPDSLPPDAEKRPYRVAGRNCEYEMLQSERFKALLKEYE